ncbi:hypothetical protein GCM10009760_61480 [Kitasatospora kazusensis]|uniref:Uncharacterized protein n=1 Tax=Kitasatospora kazusensis TaxID=407974 RepID=A0ABN3ABP5_9ACTN
MEDAMPPDGLLGLERARVGARRALDEYVCGAEVRRRAEYPDDEQVVRRRTWTDGQTRHWLGLRTHYQRAADAVRAHSAMAGAAAGRRLGELEGKLRAGVPQVMVVVRLVPGGGEQVVTVLGGVEQQPAGRSRARVAPACVPRNSAVWSRE